jgi:hypothetical protein
MANSTLIARLMVLFCSSWESVQRGMETTGFRKALTKKQGRRLTRRFELYVSVTRHSIARGGKILRPQGGNYG